MCFNKFGVCRQGQFFQCAAAFVNLWNRIGTQNNLQLPNGAPTMFSFLEQYGATQKSIQVTTKLMQDVPTQSRLCIANGNTTAYNFMHEEFFRNWEYFPQDSIEIPPNEKIEVYSFLKYKEFEIWNFSL